MSKRFYERFVVPLLREHFPQIPHAAARIGIGSEVLGYDTEMSADHDYGPCVQVFFPEAEFRSTAERVMHLLDGSLPATFEGMAVRYPTYTRPPSGDASSGMLGSDHGVEFYTLAAWCDRFLGRQFATEPTPRDWLSYSEQYFLTATAGAVFRDDIGDLTALRERLAYFPRDVWLYKLAVQWGRIAEERAYVGRTGQVGDELGSQVVAARMVGNIMRLALLIERRYAPYPKWIGTAFSGLRCSSQVAPLLEQVLAANGWEEREARLIDALRHMADLQIEAGVPGATAPLITSIHARPFRFIDTLEISNAIQAAIADEGLRQMMEFGAADQFLSNFVLAVPQLSEAAVAALMNTKPR